MPTHYVFSGSAYHGSNSTIDMLIDRHPEILVDGEIDFTLLRGIIAKEVPLASNESYGFSWAGKSRVQNAAFNGMDSTTIILDSTRSKHVQTTKNSYIVGDNLKVLQALTPTYRSTVSCIFIDPPYNTSNDFIYNDVFTTTTKTLNKEAGRLDEQGRALQTTTRGDRYHTNWLNMMYPRLRLAKTMLKNDGHIFISIDENEITNLRAMCNEIFGESNFVACFIWVSNKKGRKLATGASTTKEYILCYTKRVNKDLSIDQTWAAEIMPGIYTRPNYAEHTDETGNFVCKNQLYNTNSKFNEETAPTMVFDIYYNPETHHFKTKSVAKRHRFPVEDTTTHNPFEDEGYVHIPLHSNAKKTHLYHAWRWSQNKIKQEPHNLYVDKDSQGSYRVFTKLRGRSGSHTGIKDLIMGPSLGTKQGTRDIENLGEDDLHEMFQHPKPVTLIQMLIESCTDNDDLVLDFFSGSGTTAEAVMRANSRDNGDRRFILIQLDEATFSVNDDGVEVPTKSGKLAFNSGYRSIAEIAQERIRRVEATLCDEYPNVDFGFQSYFSAETLYRPWNTTVETVEPLEALMNLQVQKPLRDGWTPRSILTESLLSLEIPLPHHPEELVLNGHSIFRLINTIDRYPYIVACFDTNKIENTLFDSLIKSDETLHFIAFDNSVSDTQRQQYPTVHFHLI